MSLAHYGFQKLVLLNSAGYSRAELPLDNSVSIIAPNNTGKTSLINALQFLLILDKRHMNFGAHSFENTRRFYFPDNSAYILLEVLLQSGMVVIGCVGKGLSHDYEYFAYQGSLDLDDYRDEDGKLVTQPKLIARLFERKKSAKIYPQAELRALLYGNRQKQKADEPNLTIFPLEFTAQAATYQRILTRTLRLDSLNSSDVKTYLLEIFKNDLQDCNVDFKSEWDKSFADVNYDKSQYDAVFRNAAKIADMEESQQTRLGLRGKIIHFRPLIEHSLNEWEAHFNNSNAQFQQRFETLNQNHASLEVRQKDIYKDQADTNHALTNQQNIEQNFQALTVRFQFVSDLAQLQNQRQTVQNQRDELVRTIRNAEQQQSLDSIKRQLTKNAKEQNELQRQLNSLHNNLYLQLQKRLPTESFELLTRLLATSVLSLPVENELPNHRIFQNFAQEFADLSLDVSMLESNLILKTADELQTEIADCERQRTEWEMLLRTVETLAEQKQQQQKLDSKLTELDLDILAYQTFLALQNTAAERQKMLRDCQQKMVTLKHEETTLADKKNAVDGMKSTLKTEQNELQSQHRRVNQARQQRVDQQSPFDYLASLPHFPCVDFAEMKIADLANHIENYNQDCQRLRQLDATLNNQLNELHQDNITKFQAQDSAEKELETLFNYAIHLAQEQEAIERKARSAVVQIAAILCDLRDSLETLKRKMREFNTKINRCTLSDLSVFKIEPREEEILVKAIQTLISTSE